MTVKNAIQLPSAGESNRVGITCKGSAIELYRHGSGRMPVLLIGGVHGDESEGFILAERFQNELRNGSIEVSADLSLFICPRLNPDGCAAIRRTNHRNVDLNRNLPTTDWSGEFQNVRYYPGVSAGSEIESEVTIALIENIKPHMIVSLHSYEHAMNNFNGPSEELARAMSARNGLPPKGDIGYPTPGSLGTYAGWERKIPTITLEILRDQDADTVWKTHHEALIAGFEFYLHG
ncbi:MAG: DUF2817 domain-containing protein [Leptospiraceae bacterium]|nr:DUF2817 domain-containing protein [Leptospiraceae bacterium]